MGSGRARPHRPAVAPPRQPVRGGGRARLRPTLRPSTSPAWPTSPSRSSAACCAAPPPSSARPPISPPPRRCARLRTPAAPARRLELAHGLRAERSPRELRIAVSAGPATSGAGNSAVYTVPIPGQVHAAAFGLSLRIEIAGPQDATLPSHAVLRNWKPGDRVRLRHSSGPRKVKEVLERLRVTGSKPGRLAGARTGRRAGRTHRLDARRGPRTHTRHCGFRNSGEWQPVTRFPLRNFVLD